VGFARLRGRVKRNVNPQHGDRMFLASDRAHHRERKIRGFLAREPSIALVLAAVNFEWTVSRAVLFLSKTPNRVLREKMIKYHSPEKYKALWTDEVGGAAGSVSLPQVVRNWSKVIDGFRARNVLVHGKDRYTVKMATPHIEALLEGARYVDSHCEWLGKPLYARMPIRKKVAG
jgi:hypothetical protein